ncbi:acyl-CoA thioesterase [Mycetohabitans sp. B5]|uniref:(3S)-malyl-CoA thioesterase n=1 Tax=Mycetohabitans endofungorum TaxID=417203 RepID=A0A2P5K7V2_9BURK|nr:MULTISPECIES: thioesterase family protein [Mycetohabitans]MCG1054286.1 acyl-CoA thioesterase [Mycetohabitans sp. B5]PPB82798.1 (3S)-malyl-CoA thioesterase [Mycetohabitans endofungorum]
MSSDVYRHAFEMVLPIRWGDMDAFQHVNNVVYFRYMEQVRVSWFETLSLPVPDENGCGPVIVSAHMNFLRQLRYPGDVRGTMRVGKPGRSSLDSRFELTRTDAPNELIAQGGAKIVWVDYDAGKSVPLPKALLAALE